MERLLVEPCWTEGRRDWLPDQGPPSMDQSAPRGLLRCWEMSDEPQPKRPSVEGRGRAFSKEYVDDGLGEEVLSKSEVSEGSNFDPNSCRRFLLIEVNLLEGWPFASGTPILFLVRKLVI